MNIEQQILKVQMEMKEDIGIIKGTLKQLVPRINGLEKTAKTFISKGSITLIILISAGIFVPMGILAAKIIWK